MSYQYQQSCHMFHYNTRDPEEWGSNDTPALAIAPTGCSSSAACSTVMAVTQAGIACRARKLRLGLEGFPASTRLDTRPSGV